MEKDEAEEEEEDEAEEEEEEEEEGKRRCITFVHLTDRDLCIYSKQMI